MSQAKDYCFGKVIQKRDLELRDTILGPSMWTLKDNIDRAFMNKYGRDLPDIEKMSSSLSIHKRTATNLLEKQAAILLDRSKMRCAGCGGKVSLSNLLLFLKHA